MYLRSTARGNYCHWEQEAEKGTEGCGMERKIMRFPSTNLVEAHKFPSHT